MTGLVIVGQNIDTEDQQISYIGTEGIKTVVMVEHRGSVDWLQGDRGNKKGLLWYDTKSMHWLSWGRSNNWTDYNGTEQLNGLVMVGD